MDDKGISPFTEKPLVFLPEIVSPTPVLPMEKDINEEESEQSILDYSIEILEDSSEDNEFLNKRMEFEKQQQQQEQEESGSESGEEQKETPKKIKEWVPDIRGPVIDGRRINKKDDSLIDSSAGKRQNRQLGRRPVFKQESIFKDGYNPVQNKVGTQITSDTKAKYSHIFDNFPNANEEINNLQVNDEVVEVVNDEVVNDEVVNDEVVNDKVVNDEVVNDKVVNDEIDDETDADRAESAIRETNHFIRDIGLTTNNGLNHIVEYEQIIPYIIVAKSKILNTVLTEPNINSIEKLKMSKIILDEILSFSLLNVEEMYLTGNIKNQIQAYIDQYVSDISSEEVYRMCKPSFGDKRYKCVESHEVAKCLIGKCNASESCKACKQDIVCKNEALPGKKCCEDHKPVTPKELHQILMKNNKRDDEEEDEHHDKHDKHDHEYHSKHSHDERSDNDSNEYDDCSDCSDCSDGGCNDQERVCECDIECKCTVDIKNESTKKLSNKSFKRSPKKSFDKCMNVLKHKNMGTRKNPRYVPQYCGKKLRDGCSSCDKCIKQAEIVINSRKEGSSNCRQVLQNGPNKGRCCPKEEHINGFCRDHAPRDNPSNDPRTCTAIKSDGTPCGKKVDIVGDIWCGQHPNGDALGNFKNKDDDNDDSNASLEIICNWMTKKGIPCNCKGLECFDWLCGKHKDGPINKESENNKRKCGALTKKGSRCGRWAVEGTKFCNSHFEYEGHPKITECDAIIKSTGKRCACKAKDGKFCGKHKNYKGPLASKTIIEVCESSSSEEEYLVDEDDSSSEASELFDKRLEATIKGIDFQPIPTIKPTIKLVEAKNHIIETKSQSDKSEESIKTKELPVAKLPKCAGGGIYKPQSTDSVESFEQVEPVYPIDPVTKSNIYTIKQIMEFSRDRAFKRMLDGRFIETEPRKRVKRTNKTLSKSESNSNSKSSDVSMACSTTNSTSSLSKLRLIVKSESGVPIIPSPKTFEDGMEISDEISPQVQQTIEDNEIKLIAKLGGWTKEQVLEMKRVRIYKKVKKGKYFDPQGTLAETRKSLKARISKADSTAKADYRSAKFAFEELLKATYYDLLHSMGHMNGLKGVQQYRLREGLLGTCKAEITKLKKLIPTRNSKLNGLPYEGDFAAPDVNKYIEAFEDAIQYVKKESKVDAKFASYLLAAQEFEINITKKRNSPEYNAILKSKHNIETSAKMREHYSRYIVRFAKVALKLKFDSCEGFANFYMNKLKEQNIDYSKIPFLFTGSYETAMEDVILEILDQNKDTQTMSFIDIDISSFGDHHEQTGLNSRERKEISIDISSRYSFDEFYRPLTKGECPTQEELEELYSKTVDEKMVDMFTKFAEKTWVETSHKTKVEKKGEEKAEEEQRLIDYSRQLAKNKATEWTERQNGRKVQNAVLIMDAMGCQYNLKALADYIVKG